MEKPIISVIVPTYKEAKNIPTLVEKINEAMERERAFNMRLS